jgi:hypothetical protein
VSVIVIVIVSSIFTRDVSRREGVSLDWGCEVCGVWQRWDEHEGEEGVELTAVLS